MIYNQQENLDDILFHYYNTLEKEVLKVKNKLINESLLLTIFKLSTNAASEVINASAVDGILFNNDVIKYLINHGFIRLSDHKGISKTYVLTAKGIWYVETKIKELDLDDLLNFFQEEKFSSAFSNTPPNDKERIILFTMIAMRLFSPNTVMDLNSQTIGDTWIEVFDICADYLYSYGVIKSTEWKSDSRGNEHPVNYVMRRMNKLPQKTRHLYQSGNNYQYFLEIGNKDDEVIDNLVFLLSLIFLGKRDQIVIGDLSTFLSDTAYEKSIGLLNSFEYINHTWDKTMAEAVERFTYEID